MSDSSVCEKKCNCMEVHSDECPYRKRFEVQDLSVYQKFRLEVLKKSGDFIQYHKTFAQYASEVEKDKNTIESHKRRFIVRVGSAFGTKDIPVRDVHKIPESEKIRFQIAQLQSELESVEHIERLFPVFLTLAPGDVIVSHSGTERLVTKVTDTDIFTENDGVAEEPLLKADLFDVRFDWVRDVHKKK